jgi:hypothetical protein
MDCTPPSCCEVSPTLLTLILKVFYSRELDGLLAETRHIRPAHFVLGDFLAWYISTAVTDTVKKSCIMTSETAEAGNQSVERLSSVGILSS